MKSSELVTVIIVITKVKNNCSNTTEERDNASTIVLILVGERIGSPD